MPDKEAIERKVDAVEAHPNANKVPPPTVGKYQYTGEYRTPKFGEHFLGDNNCDLPKIVNTLYTVRHMGKFGTNRYIYKPVPSDEAVEVAPTACEDREGDKCEVTERHHKLAGILWGRDAKEWPAIIARHESSQAGSFQSNYETLRAACQALFDAPHQEHFVTRLNDEENAALKRIRAALSQPVKQDLEREAPLPSTEEAFDNAVCQLADEEAAHQNTLRRLAEAKSQLATALNWLPRKDRVMFEEMQAAKLKPRDASQLPEVQDAEAHSAKAD